MNDTMRTALVTFLAVFVVVVAAGAVYGFVLGDDTSGETVPDHIEVENPQYDADRVSSDRTPGEASVDVDTHVFDNEVVVHLGAGLSERDVAPLLNGIIESGNDVTLVSDGEQQMPPGPIIMSNDAVNQVTPPTGEEPEESVLEEPLEEAHGFISVGVDSYVEEDLDAISEFVDDDGRVVMAVDPAQDFAFGEGLSETFSEFGVFTEPGYVYNLAENDLNYQRIFAEPEGTSMLTHGIDRVVFDTATPVQANVEAESMVPIEGSELSVTREETDKPVLVRSDDVVLVGDTGFMSPENTLRADNDEFVGNIGEFLLESDRALDGDETANGDDEEESHTITIAVGPDGEPRFSPDVVEIEPGWTVEFEWESDGHNLVPVHQEPDDLEWDGVEEVQNESFVHEVTFEEEGIHEFVSEPYEDEGMFGVIIVGER